MQSSVSMELADPTPISCPCDPIFVAPNGSYPRGKSLLCKAFMLNDKDVFLNHGSFGATPRIVAEKQQELVARMESNPDVWFRYDFKPLWLDAVAVVADMTGSDKDDIVFVKNATAGVNAVARQLKLSKGDTCLIANQTYGACANAIRDVCEKSGAECVELEIPRNALVDDDKLVELLDEQLTSAPKTKFVLLDHITSPTAVLLPIARLCGLCRSKGVQVMVDGAHAPGNVLPRLDIPSIGADWYVGNLHKWCFTPKSAAFLWVAKPLQAAAQGVVISHEYTSDYQSRFAMQGTLDDTAFITVPTAIQFIKTMGGQHSIFEYNNALVGWAATMLVARWGTELLVPLEKCTTMACIRCPLDTYDAEGVDLFKLIWDRFRIVVPIVRMPAVDGRWARISAQIYNEPADYEKLAVAVLQLKAEKP
eukprot:TRINITY_DN44448_c0_g1_i1.p1 TRINITY_DN44448_c0_g1~~TRINITY_DN44448_c0_g1_i1.p1  ORF type:complete len:422 (-),score=78.27 TRINITY_DN44448_c0_g1_i1:197-1462(-)